MLIVKPDVKLQKPFVGSDLRFIPESDVLDVDTTILLSGFTGHVLGCYERKEVPLGLDDWLLREYQLNGWKPYEVKHDSSLPKAV